MKRETKLFNLNKPALILAFVISACFHTRAQSGYDIKLNLKGSKDTLALLLKYQFDQTYIVDSSKNVKNGQMQFKGKTDLDKGVYVIVNQEKVPYFEFIVNEGQKFSISADASDIVSTTKFTGSKENETFFTYVKYSGGKNKEFNAARSQTAGKSKEDSAKFMMEKINQLNEDVKKFDAEFLIKVKGTYIYDLLNLKTEKTATEIPKASNGRPDSTYPYYYYKSHYFDGVDFKDDRIVFNPYFDDRVKNYFENVILQHPDTVIQEIDKILSRCKEGTVTYKVLVGYFTYKAEQSKLISFDKVFVHMADTYILNGKGKGIYEEETIKSIGKRIDVLRNLLEGKKVPDLYMIDTTYTRQVKKMGFDTITSSKSITELYYKNEKVLAPLFKTLYQVNANYTVLLFWAADCGHCKTEVPKLHETLKELKGKVDVKVFAVQTRDDLFDMWRHFIIDNKLTDFIHVGDPVHINDVKGKFDVVSTPMVYILDSDKKILAKKLKSEQVVDMIKDLERQRKP